MRILLPILTLALLAGCSSTKDFAEALDSRQNAGACPAVGSIYDAARIVQFNEGAKDVYSDITYTGDADWEANIDVQVQGGNPPNLANFPQPGKLADFVVLSGNPLTVDPMTIGELEVVQTIKEGRTVYKRGSGD